MTCRYLYLTSSEARNTNQLVAPGTLALHSSQATTFELPYFIPVLLGSFQTSLVVSHWTPMPQLWSPRNLSVVQQWAEKNDICSSTVSREQNRSWTSPSCKHEHEHVWKKEQGTVRETACVPEQAFYGAEARSALQTPGWDLTNWCSVKYLLEEMPSCTWPAGSTEVKSLGERKVSWGCLSAGSGGTCWLQLRMNLVICVEKDVVK